MSSPHEGPGVYGLVKEGDFHYVGRSDANLKEQIESHELTCPICGCEIDTYEYKNCTDAEEAYELECRLFHAHQEKICNDLHPRKPSGNHAQCPVCGD